MEICQVKVRKHHICGQKSEALLIDTDTVEMRYRARMNTDAESNPLAQSPTQGPDSQSISYTVGLLKLILPLCIIRNSFDFFNSVSC